jgi:CheY-specific phosphatase CheX
VICGNPNTARGQWNAGTFATAALNTGSKMWRAMTLQELEDAVKRLLAEIEQILSGNAVEERGI